MVAAYEEVKHLDSASRDMFDEPCQTKAFHVPSFFSEPEKRPIRDFMMKFEQPNFLLSTDLDARSSSLHWLTLYRADEDAQFSATDVKRLHMLAPHLKQALALNHAVHLGKAMIRTAGHSRPSTAIADKKGMVYARDDQFFNIIQDACGWEFNSDRYLPPDLVSELQAGEKVFSWRQLVVQCHAEHGLIVVKLRAKTLADSLTEREKTIALLVSKGFTHKQVAAQLGRSPATVRNQIQVIYAKLQVNNIAELVQALSESR